MPRQSSRSDSPRPKFQYRQRTYENARRRAEQSSGTRDNYISQEVVFYKPTEGENLLRILPPTWENPEHYGLDIYVHYGIGPDQAAYLCRNYMKHDDRRCPICEEREKADRVGDKEYAKKLKATKRVLFYLIDRDHESDGIKAWASPWTVDRDIMVQATDQRTREVLPLDDPDAGYDVRLTRVGQKDRTEYTVAIARRPSAVEFTEEMVDALDNKSLPSILVFYDYDHIKAAFDGAGSGREEQETYDRSRAGSATQTVTAPPSKPSRRSTPPTPNWNDVHDMEGTQLDQLAADFNLDMDPDAYDTDEEFADAICKELGVQAPSKPTRSAAKVVVKDEEEDEVPFDIDEAEDATPPPKSALSARLASLRNRK